MKKALYNKWFWGALLFGTLLAVTSAIFSMYRYESGIHEIYELTFVDGEFTKDPGFSIFSAYVAWIGGEGISLAYSLFYLFIPLMACIPFSWSGKAEKDSGYIMQLIFRTGRNRYYMIKVIVCFITGALVVLIPIIINIVCIFSFIPAYNLDAIYEIYYPMGFPNMFSKMFYRNPVWYTAIYILFTVVYSGMYSVFGYSLAYYVKNRYLCMAVPFLIVIVINYLSSLNVSYNVEISPVLFLHATPLSRDNRLGVVLAELFCMFIISGFNIIYRRCKSDVL